MMRGPASRRPRPPRAVGTVHHRPPGPRQGHDRVLRPAQRQVGTPTCVRVSAALRCLRGGSPMRCRARAVGSGPRTSRSPRLRARRRPRECDERISPKLGLDVQLGEQLAHAWETVGRIDAEPPKEDRAEPPLSSRKLKVVDPRGSGWCVGKMGCTPDGARQRPTRHARPYEVDRLVIKIDDFAQRGALGTMRVRWLAREQVSIATSRRSARARLVENEPWVLVEVLEPGGSAREISTVTRVPPASPSITSVV